ncbi:MAG: hypothetical protein H0X62_03035, partial [Bacteroidetes bacterium]|nr:hypothetical protein [Bacteroidota bacterium]
VENLLKWPVAKNGKYEIIPSEIKLHDIVAETFGLLKENTAHKHVKFRPLISKKTKVIADRAMLQTVISSLLACTIKSLPGPGEVSIEANDKGNFVEVNITDSNVAINKSLIPPIINNLARNKNKKLKAGASGIELLLCKELIEAQGGAAQFAKENNTCNFTFTIPKPSGKGSTEVNKITPPSKLSAA